MCSRDYIDMNTLYIPLTQVDLCFAHKLHKMKATSLLCHYLSSNLLENPELRNKTERNS